MTIVHTVATLRADHGGPSRSIPALCAALAASGAQVSLLSTAVDAPTITAPESVPHVQARGPGLVAAHLRRGPFVSELERHLSPGSTILHDHGIWLPTNHLVARVGRKHAVPRVVSIRGMLSAWALEQSRRRKRWAWHAYQRRDLASAAAIHVTSEAELMDVRRLRVDVPVAVVPNGVEVPAAMPPRARGGPRRALFLSRVHAKKGLLDLVQAWSSVRPAGWQLVIAGSDTDGHLAAVARAIAAAGLDGEVSLIGAVSDAAKWELYATAELFVLPTRSENFGLAIAEALAAGVPVITTRGAPWAELETHRCGWWIDIGVEPLAAALREATTAPADRLVQMGERGRQLIAQRYVWARVAERMSAVYGWLLHGGDPPSDVQ